MNTLSTSVKRAWQYTWVRLAAVLVLVGLIGSIFSNGFSGEEAVTPSAATPVVSLTTAASFAADTPLSLIGRVRSLEEATVTAERGGRVVTVPVSLGDEVAAGTIIATLENASERAAVVQAEGRYEAALAGAAQSNIGVDEALANVQAAKNNAVSTIRTAYNTGNSVVRNSVDTFFSDPDGFVPGLKINGRGSTAELNQARVELQTMLPAWEADARTITASDDLNASLERSRGRIQTIVHLIDQFLTVFENQDRSSRYTQEELRGFRNTFTGLRAELIAIDSQIDAAETRLQTAQDTLRRAELGGTGGETSAADAQVKQALGALQAAQAQLAKTILRTPVAGTVNSLSVRTGDFITSFSPVAVVANNNAFEIITYVSQADRERIAVGDTITIADALSGRVSTIASAVDADTGKIEVRITATGAGLTAGDTVRITKQTKRAAPAPERIRVPLTAIRFVGEQPYVFTVSEDNRLQRQFITLGDILGESVTVAEGLSASEPFVADARGLVSSTTVTVRDTNF